MSDRSLAAAHAAHERWSRATPEERREGNRRARETWLARFAAEADPDGTLDPIEREQAAARLLAAHMSRLALKAAAARREHRRERLAAANRATVDAILAICDGAHDWPGDLDRADAACLRCGLPYTEFAA
jgi:hypothetical protein